MHSILNSSDKDILLPLEILVSWTLCNLCYSYQTTTVRKLDVHPPSGKKHWCYSPSCVCQEE